MADIIKITDDTYRVEDELLKGAQEIQEGTASGSEVDIYGTKAMLYKFPYAGLLCDR